MIFFIVVFSFLFENEKWNRFAKRFHGKMHQKNASLPLIAPHKVICDSPADILRRPSIAGHRQTGSASAVFPFPYGGCLALPKGNDVYRASIKRFNFVTS